LSKNTITNVSAPSRKCEAISNSLDSHPRRRFLASLFDLLKNHINQHAAYDSFEREQEEASICKEGTRTEVLQKINAWARDENGLRMCWLNGPAGSGKSGLFIYSRSCREH
jgi:hypothetical protein